MRPNFALLVGAVAQQGSDLGLTCRAEEKTCCTMLLQGHSDWHGACQGTLRLEGGAAASRLSRVLTHGTSTGNDAPLFWNALNVLTFQESVRYSPQWVHPTGDLCTHQTQQPVSGSEALLVGSSPSGRSPRALADSSRVHVPLASLLLECATSAYFNCPSDGFPSGCRDGQPFSYCWPLSMQQCTMGQDYKKASSLTLNSFGSAYFQDVFP